MNQIVYYKIIISILLFLLVTPLSGKLIKPTENGEQKEVLIINSKRRLYYPVKSEGLVFSISGPKRLEFISRFPVLRKKKKSYSFSYRIVLNEKDTINVRHKYKIQKTVRSVQHPKHNYTFSGNYFINLDKGQNKIEILENSDQKLPTLVRVLSKEFENPGKKKKIITPSIHKNPVLLVSENKNIEYFECSSTLPLKIQTNGENILKIINRLEFTEKMGQQESFRIRIKEGNRVIGTYYFNTERSSASKIIGKDDIVPGKWRSCEIKVPKGGHSYSVEILDREKTVLTRFILY